MTLRILFVSNCLPYPATTGGNQRTELLVRALSSLGKVDIVQVSRDGPVHPTILEQARKSFSVLGAIEPIPRGRVWPWGVLRPIHPRLVDRLAGVIGSQAVLYRPDPAVAAFVEKVLSNGRYDLIVGRLLVPCALAGLFSIAHGLPVLVDLDDVDNVVARENVKRSTPLLRRLVFLMHKAAIEKAVPPLLASAAYMWVAARDDASGLVGQKSGVLPNIPYQPPGVVRTACAPNDQSKQILVVGMLDFRPNTEGIDQFLENSWEKIRLTVPDASLRIVGGRLSAKLQRKWAAIPGVEIAGFVEDLRAEYQRCAFSIVPIQRGGGTKIKAVECFSFGRTCVVTPHGHRGIESVLLHGQALWRGNTSAEFAEGCIKLLLNSDYRNALAEQGQRLVSEHYSFERFMHAIERGVRTVLPDLD